MATTPKVRNCIGLGISTADAVKIGKRADALNLESVEESYAMAVEDMLVKMIERRDSIAKAMAVEVSKLPAADAGVAAAGKEGVEKPKKKPVTPQLPPAAPVAKTTPVKQRIEQARQERADYFTPGNIVQSYGGTDEVISYTPPKEDGGGWSVKVHAVKKVNGEWVRIGKPQDARTHSTQPDAQALKSGPLDKVKPAAAADVPHTEPRADGKPFPNSEARGEAEQVPESLPENWREGVNQETNRPALNYNPQSGAHWASVQNPIGNAYEIEYKKGQTVIEKSEVVGTRNDVIRQVQKRVSELSGDPVHQDPGKSPEVATAPVIAQSLAKAANKEDKSQKEMRLWLLSEIDKAVKLTEDYADYQQKIKEYGQSVADSVFYGKANGSVGLTTPPGNGMITFDVPGDGKFKIRNSLRGLMEFRAKVEGKSGTGFTDKPTKPKGLPASTGVAKGSSNQIEALSNMLEELDFEAAVDYARETGVSLNDAKVAPHIRDQLNAYLKGGTLPPPPFSPSRYWEYQASIRADKDGNPIREASLTKEIGADTYIANVSGTNATGFTFTVTKGAEAFEKKSGTYRTFSDALQGAESKINSIQPEVVKPKDTGWNMAGVGFAGKRYRGRNITLDDGREVVARIYENAGQYEDAEVKVDGKRVFAKTDRYRAEKLADDFIATLTQKAPVNETQQKFEAEQAAIKAEVDTAEKSAEPEANDEPIPAITEAQARKQFEWRNMGQKDGTKSHFLFFFESPADKGTGAAMRRGAVELYPGASGWKVEDGDGTAYKSLADAKAAAIDAAIPILQEQGYVLKPAQAATAILDAANITGKERVDALKDVKKGDITPEELEAAYPASAGKFEQHNAIAQEYGYTVADDGSIALASGKESGVKVILKGSRFQIRSKSTDDIVYSGATVDSMGKFLESFWGAEKAAKEAKPAAQEQANDRDHFTLERLNQETNSMEPVTFTRGEYVRHKLGTGEIDGISQAKQEFSVEGIWYPFGYAYKAERPEAPKADTIPMSEAIDAVNRKNGQGLTDADRVPASILDAETALWTRITDGTATLDEFKAGFARWVDGKDAIIEALSKNTKDQLLKRRGLFYDRYKNEPKAELVDAMWRDGVTRYVLARSFSHGMGKNAWLDGVRNMVESTDANQLKQYAAEVKAEREEAVARGAKIAEAIKDPQTLDDYKTWMRATMTGGKTFKESRMALTPEQRAKFDDLTATESRAERASRKVAAQDTVLRAPGEAVTATDIIKTKHTKHGHDLWQFNLDQRVSGDEFKSLVTQAKRLGGDYSSYRGNGAIPGWQFRTEDAAKAFKALIAGDATAAKDVMQERRDSFADDRSQSATERLNEMADRLEERADASLNQERKQNTNKRAAQAASAEAAANAEKAMAKTMRNIAQAISDGKAKFLDRVRQKTQVSALLTAVNTAKNDELRAKYPSYSEQERHKGEAATNETADFAEFPAFTAYRSDLATLARQLVDVDGTKKLGQQLLKVADDVSDAYLKFAKENFSQVASFSKTDGGIAGFSTKDAAEAAIARSGYKGKAIAYQVKRGEYTVIMSPSEAIERGIWKGDGDKRITLSGEFGTELVEKIGKAGRRGAPVSVPWQMETAHDRRKVLERMGIETPAEYRAALREFIGLQEVSEAPNKVKQLERAMVGRSNDGMDFFPTPESVADEMVEAAGIEPGMAVLEPSAGWGHIAERIRAAGVEPDVGEMSNDRQELLEAKGFNVVSRDFLNMSPRGFTYGDVFKHADGRIGILGGNGGLGSSRYRLISMDGDGRNFDYVDREDLTGVEQRGSNRGYDRILMNPPFSDGRDIQHVQHAYSLLRPGGRIVAIMGESAFTNQNKRATEFREWLDSVGGTSEKLAEGSFNDPSLPVNTGANARMVVIEKSDDNGDAKFSQGLLSPASFGPKPTLDQIQRLVDKVLQVAKNIVPVSVIGNPSQISGIQVPTGAKPKGALIDGRIYLFTDNIQSIGDAYVTLFHELFHLGLQKVIPAEDYATMLRQFSRNVLVQKYVREWKASPEGVEKAATMPSAAYEALAAEEAMAMISEELSANSGVGTRKLPGLVKTMLSWFAGVADRLGFPAHIGNWMRKLTQNAAEKFVTDMVRASMGGDKNLGKTQAKYGTLTAEMTAQTRLSAGGRGTNDPMTSKPLTEKQFYSQYAQHIDLRGRDGSAKATRESILKDGFKKGANVNAMPPYRGGAPTNILDKKFMPKKGDIVYLAPKSAWKDRPNGMEIQDGWVPAPHEVIEVSEDGASMYQEYLQALGGRSEIAAQPSSTSNVAVSKLNRVMRDAGWEVEYIDIDLTAEKPKATIRINRDDGRFLIAKVDSLGRANFETFQREMGLRMDPSTKGRRPLSPMVEDIFLGRQRYEGARSMLRGMTNYLVDNASNPVALADMRSAWAGVMNGPVKQEYALPFSEPTAPDSGGVKFSQGLGHALNNAANNVRDGLNKATVTDLKHQFGNRLADFRGLGLQTLGRRQLVDLYAGDLPQMESYSRMVAQMDADKNESGAEADALATGWGKLKDERQLAELMHDATLAQIDPDKGFVAGDDQNFYDALKDGFDKLTPEAKAAYRKARDMYSEHNDKVRLAIRERIMRSEMSSAKKQALLTKMDGEFFKKVKGVYFPLARFGQYVTIVKDSRGEVLSANRSETMNEAEATRKILLAKFPASGGYKVGKVLKDKEFNAARDGVGRGFMADLFETLDKTNAGDELTDAISQLYLAALPDLSWAKHGIHRKGTPGFSQDARRAFAQNMFHGARYLAKLRYADQLQTKLDDMQEHIVSKADVAAFDSVKAQQVVDEMVKRHDSMMNPATNPISTALTSFGFVFHLGLSPASALVNLSQTALVAYPVMGAKWGFGKASAALMNASRQAAGNKNDISKALSGEDLEAYNEAVRAGVIDVTMAHDLAGIAQGEDSKVSAKIRPVMKAASFLFHHAEKFNRQVTFVAAYRLAKESGAGHLSAYDQAVKATYDGHFDYSASNRPRVMQGNVAKVVLLFKQYAQNMVYTLTRQAQLSLNGATPAERAEARKALGGLLVSHALAAGALGLPMVGMLLSAASMIGGDDDEPWDAKAALQNMLADTLGQKPAEVFAHGLSRLTPWDISGRVGLDKLLLPDVQEGLEGADAVKNWMAAALGPVAGIAVNAGKGMQDIANGQYARGLESMLPSALRAPLKAYRYGTEGNIDKTGVAINEEIGAAGVAGQALGFSPSEARLAQEGKSAIYSADRAIQERRSSLTRQFALAAMAKDQEGMADARKDIARFNEKNPKARITPINLMQSVRARRKRIEQAEQGVYLPKKRQDAIDAGRFAVAD